MHEATAEAKLPLRAQDEVSCTHCAVHCEKVVYPGACIRMACPFVYAYEAWGHTYMGCLQKVFDVEIDLRLLESAEATVNGFGAVRARRAPLPMCEVEVVVPALQELLTLTSDDLWLCMENAAGAGGTIGRSVAELAVLSDAVGGHPRLGLCLDSCHWWASGIDVSDRGVLEAAIDDIDARLGLERLRVLHVNDSKTPLGSNRDRHELVGNGVIGDGLATFLGHPAFQDLPAILETAGEKGYAEELRLMRALYAKGRRRRPKPRA